MRSCPGQLGKTVRMGEADRKGERKEKMRVIVRKQTTEGKNKRPPAEFLCSRTLPEKKRKESEAKEEREEKRQGRIESNDQKCRDEDRK